MAVPDQLFSNMHRAALGWLRGRSPEDISLRANVAFDGKIFHLKSLGQEIAVTYPEYEIQPQLHFWHALTILHYLSHADGTQPSGELISFAQHKNGMVRGGGFDHKAEQAIGEKLGALSEEELLRRIHMLGGKPIPGNADLNVKFSYAPNYPVYLKIWFADEDFPASGRLFLDASAEHSLTIEDAVTVGEIIHERLTNTFPISP